MGAGKGGQEGMGISLIVSTVKIKKKKETQQLNAVCVPGLHLFAKRAILGQMEKLSGV